MRAAWEIKAGVPAAKNPPQLPVYGCAHLDLLLNNLVGGAQHIQVNLAA